MLRILCLSLCLLTVQIARAQEAPAAASETYEVVTPHYRLTMPKPIETTTAEKVETPWGKATMTEHFARDEYRMSYIFRAYDFPSSRSLSAAKLRQVRSFFLQNRGCSAKDVPPSAWKGDKAWRAPFSPGYLTPPKIWKDAKGKPWPQTLFAGVCVSGDEFIILQAIANGRLYRLHIAGDRGFVPLQEKADAMSWMIDHIELFEK